MTTSSQPVRVIQWCTGKIGQIAIRHFAANPAFELVGVYTTSADKNGVDAGALAGIGPLGVTATTDREALLALDADCVNYLPLKVDIDELEELLRSGKNVVTAVGLTFPPPDDERTARLQAACEAGGTTLHGGGIHPGFVGDIFPLVASRLLSRIDQLVVTEVCDFSDHPGAKMIFDLFGFGLTPDEARKHAVAIMGEVDAPYAESMALLATALGLNVERYSHELTMAVSDRDLTIAAGVIRAGTVAGMRRRWEAIVDGRPALVFLSNWKMADDLTPDICDGTNRYILEFFGEPATKITLEHLEPSATGDPGYPGRIWTGMSAVNLIHDVVAAPPGVRTHLDLPLGRPRGLFHKGETWRPSA
ncbi:dihydrodipicolinate reductase [Frankia sp. CNm7]|uniref:Dihydrodipicolinate reductase n=1 Tax=Frankia nepalensis TaxID=1836974 RepID=A0A937RMU0_9ACTN|nr:dihydrodipicolinate reductase [Frankia nepalensis]MBL7498264.1 dihydrodipicolinate reductase [Frankia nepalensis]MBL7509144.1 dihydrodipicolinate reductase [Frankia nepalensis]MBL7519159.1 dihydrodipicolinate reductase [Frankia nepalensis]MBL7630189.1 dihydrodipicolinate reductase [Frankia nepalensis]